MPSSYWPPESKLFTEKTASSVEVSWYNTSLAHILVCKGSDLRGYGVEYYTKKLVTKQKSWLSKIHKAKAHSKRKLTISTAQANKHWPSISDLL